jgi:hypothetical protein
MQEELNTKKKAQRYCLKCKTLNNKDSLHCHNCQYPVKNFYLFYNYDAYRNSQSTEVLRVFVELFIKVYELYMDLFDSNENIHNIWKEINITCINNNTLQLTRNIESFILFLQDNCLNIDPEDINNLTEELNKIKSKQYQDIFMEEDHELTKSLNTVKKQLNGVTITPETEELEITFSGKMIYFNFDCIALNPYRILGISSETDFKELETLLDPLKSDHIKNIPVLLPEFSTVNISYETVSQAFQEIKIPSKRIMHKIFWFASNDIDLKTLTISNYSHYIKLFKNSIDDFKAHDIELLKLIRAFSIDPCVEDIDLWIETITDWHKFVTNHSYWQTLLEQEKLNSFNLKVSNVELALARKESKYLILKSISDKAIKDIETNPDVSLRVLTLFEKLNENNLIDFDHFYNLSNSIVNRFEDIIEEKIKIFIVTLKEVNKPDIQNEIKLNAYLNASNTIEIDILNWLNKVIMPFSETHYRDCEAIKETITDLLIKLADAYIAISQNAPAHYLVNAAIPLTKSKKQLTQLFKLKKILDIIPQEGSDNKVQDEVQTVESNPQNDYSYYNQNIDQLYSLATRFNWGAFAFTWLWGIFNYTYKPLSFFLWFIVFNIFITVMFSWVWILPDVNPEGYFKTMYIAFYLVLMIICGIKGNEWSLKSNKWKNFKHFQNVQSVWNNCGRLFAGISLLLYLLFFSSFMAPLFDFFWSGLNIY